MYKIDVDKIYRIIDTNNNKLTCNVFNNDRINFLNELSRLILDCKICRKHSDLISLSFWLRKKNILAFKKINSTNDIRVPRGTILHITPNNVPTNFMYSFTWGFMTGNINLVKLPSKNFIQVDLLIKIIKNLLKKKKYFKISKSNFFFKYDRNEAKITSKLSKISDIRIVWGSDETISKIKNFDTKIKTKDIFFNNRFSTCIINSSQFNKCTVKNKDKIIIKFYNDVFPFDQNACTSPHLVVWVGNNSDTLKAKKCFWKKLSMLVQKKYKLNIAFSSKKFSYANELLANDNMPIKNFSNFDNLIYVTCLKNINFDLYKSFRKFGFFFEYDAKTFDILKKLNSPKYQTLTYFGFDDLLLRKELNKISFFDRIVPIGKSMEMQFTWDGYDLFSELTRKINLI